MLKRQGKTFLIINLSYFGDVILTGQLCADIKLNYPKSKTVFITNKPFVDVARGLYGVDEVFALNKKGEHKGLLGLLKFAFGFKYFNKVDTSIVIYGNARGILLSWLLRAKERLSGDVGVLNVFLTHIQKYRGDTPHMSDANASILQLLTNRDSHEAEALYTPSDNAQEYIKRHLKVNDKELIGLSPLSKDKKKDLTPESAAEFIRLVNNSGRQVVLTGVAEASCFADELYSLGADFIDMTGKTSIPQLASVIKECKAFVSVDTGSLHLSCAVKTPTLCLYFSKHMIDKWAPKNRDRHLVVYTPEKISGKKAYENLEALLQKV